MFTCPYTHCIQIEVHMQTCRCICLRCICLHIYTDSYIFGETHTHFDIRIHIHILGHTPNYMHTFIQASIHPSMHTETHTHVGLCVQADYMYNSTLYCAIVVSTCNCYFSSYPRLSRAKKQRAGWAAIGWAGSAHAAARPSATSAVDLGSSTTRERPSCNHNRTLGQAQLPGINYRSNHDSLEIQT